MKWMRMRKDREWVSPYERHPYVPIVLAVLSAIVGVIAILLRVLPLLTK